MDLPDAQSPSVILAVPTEAELMGPYKLTREYWGDHLSMEDYIDRESTICSMKMPHEGLFSEAILTLADREPGDRPILTYFDLFRRRAWYAPGSGKTTPVENHMIVQISSVVTDPKYRGRGYASRALNLLAAMAEASHTSDATSMLPPKQAMLPIFDQPISFTGLHSNIGDFYAKVGFKAHPGSIIHFPVNAGGTAPSKDNSTIHVKKLYTTSVLKPCARDETLLHQYLQHRGSLSGPAMAIPPDFCNQMYHWMRDEHFIQVSHDAERVAQGQYDDKPITNIAKGAMATLADGSRLWIIWARVHYSTGPLFAIHRVSGDGIYRRLIEREQQSEPKGPKACPYADEAGLVSDGELASALRALLDVALAEAAAQKLAEVVMWNPDPVTRELIAASGVSWTENVRDKGIPFLNTHGPLKKIRDTVEWFANERYVCY